MVRLTAKQKAGLKLFGKRYRRKRRQKRGKRKPFTKAQTAATKKIVSRALDRAIEDKFLLDSNFSQHQVNWNLTQKSCLINVTPAIARGDSRANRNGDKVMLKYLRSFIRILPPANSRVEQAAPNGAPSTVENWNVHHPPYRVILLKMNREMYGKLTQDELLQVLNSRYLPRGMCRQDVQQDPGKKGLVGITKLGEFYMKSRYKQLWSTALPVDSTGVIAAPGGSGTNTTTGTGVVHYQWTAVPQFSYRNYLSNKMRQKVVIDNQFDEPVKYQYFYFVQCQDMFLDATYDVTVELAPQAIDVRNLWVFEDA